mgnify:CR=1 FL=1
MLLFIGLIIVWPIMLAIGITLSVRYSRKIRNVKSVATWKAIFLMLISYPLAIAATFSVVLLFFRLIDSEPWSSSAILLSPMFGFWGPVLIKKYMSFLWVTKT